MRFFIYAPREFANEKTLYAFDNDETLMFFEEGVFTNDFGLCEVDEETAKRNAHGGGRYMATPYVSRHLNEVYPTWEELKGLMAESTNYDREEAERYNAQYGLNK